MLHKAIPASSRAQGTQPARQKSELPFAAGQPTLKAQHQEDMNKSAGDMPASRNKLHPKSFTQHWEEPKVCLGIFFPGMTILSCRLSSCPREIICMHPADTLFLPCRSTRMLLSGYLSP
jgi:hypothetical protein